METLTEFWSITNIFFLFFAILANSQFDNPRVTTELGELEGRIVFVEDPAGNQTIFVKEFLAIPYAQPPIERFKKPEPVEAWGDCLLQCHDMPKTCFQFTHAPFPWIMYKPDMSEDCLYMNIWVPNDASPRNQKKVLFFIHGGGFLEGSGSASQPIYGGEVLAGLGDVIVVVTNYRLGAFGFWTNRIKDDAPGNVGIWDIIEALRWVNKHIEKFGGDKHGVTIAGQGFGGVIVSLFGMIPHAHGLYDRQIIQSGVAPSYLYDFGHNAFILSSIIAEKVDCAHRPNYTLYSTERITKGVTECMRDLETVYPEELIKQEIGKDFYFPLYGDELFPKSPKISMQKHAFSYAPLLIGVSGHEGMPQVTRMMIERFGILGQFEDPEFSKLDAEELLEKAIHYNKYMETLEETYLDGHGQCAVDWRLLVGQAIGDLITVCPTIYFANAYAKNNSEVYFYDFQYRPVKSKWAKWIGPTHFDEVDFVFGGPLKKSTSYPEREKRLSRMMITHWTNFVKYGKPSDHWPLYAPDTFDSMMYIGGLSPVEAPAYRGHKCKQFLENLNKTDMSFEPALLGPYGFYLKDIHQKPNISTDIYKTLGNVGNK